MSFVLYMVGVLTGVLLSMACEPFYKTYRDPYPPRSDSDREFMRNAANAIAAKYGDAE